VIPERMRHLRWWVVWVAMIPYTIIFLPFYVIGKYARRGAVALMTWGGW
jgi:hypothetical protein